MNKLSSTTPFRLPQKKLFFSLLSETEVPAPKKSNVQASPLNAEKKPVPAAPRPSQQQQTAPIAPSKPATPPQPQTAPRSPSSAAKAPTKPSIPKKEPAHLAFAQMEKLVSSIDPGMKVYSEDVKVERKRIFIAFESGDFYTRLKGAIETHIGQVTLGTLGDLKSDTAYDLYLLSHTIATSEEAKSLFDSISFSSSPAYSSGLFNGSPLVTLEQTSTYDDKELKKALWTHLKAFAL